MSQSLLALFDQAQERLPPDLRSVVDGSWHALRDPLLAHAPPGIERLLPVLPRVLAASDFVARTCVQQPELLQGMLASGDLLRAYRPGELSQKTARACEPAADEAGLKQCLRRLRRREMIRIAVRDLAGWADLGEVLSTVSELADACLQAALDRLHGWAVQRYGTPQGEAARLVVLGLGKLGGYELNFSSDIDLIFCYPQEGTTRGGSDLSNHEFFVRLGQALINALNEPTADGFVFRVDMRLRPNGASGPLALSFDAMEQYYQLHGRDWERYAYIKARVAAGDHDAGGELLDTLRPFVYRKYLDYGAIEAIRSMKGMIEREIARKGMEGNIKLGRGGIREIEFIAQALQLIRGGREPQLQVRALQEVLPRLAARGYLEPEAARELDEAYVFLRNLEHRLQMFADQQTQQLPGDDGARLRLAVACGLDDWPALAAVLEAHRERVHRQFVKLFRTAPQPGAAEPVDPLVALWQGALEGGSARESLRAHGYGEPDEVLALLKQFRSGPAYQALSSIGRERTDRVVPRVIAEAGKGAEPLAALRRLVSLLESIGRRTAYFSLMADNPQVLTQLVKLGAASPWIANWIAQHPILLDELLDPTLYELPSPQALRDELRQRLAHIPEDDLELTMEVLREFRHAHVLRVAAADVGPGLAPELTGAALATVAEGVLEGSLEVARRDLERRHGRPRCPGDESIPGFAVVGYGKLGSRELGYGSDLDMIFVYEGCEEGATDGERSLSNEQYFARLGQRLIHIVTTRTPGGILYDVDMRLRPSGKSGPLVASLAAFERYQREQAWTWEHQALVRARPLAGDAVVMREFERVRREILCRERDETKLQQEVRAMRERMLETHAGRSAESFDLKHDRGGIVDIEFMVQYWVLRWVAGHPELARHTDNISLLRMLAEAGLIDRERAEFLMGAYRRYLSLEHHLKLAERGSLIARAELGELPERVRGIWGDVVGENGVS